MNHLVPGILLLSLASVGISCKKDEEEKKKGAPIGAPEVAPPVERNLPAGMTTAALRLDENAERTPKDIAIDALKAKIAPTEGQAVGVLQRLEIVDEGMKELDVRAQDNPRACLEPTVTPESYSIGGSLPAAQTFALSFQCQEDLDDNPDTQLGFGMDETNLYLMNRTKNTTGGITVLAKAAKDGSSSHVWQIAVDGDNADFFQILATDGEGFETSVAGTDITGNSGGHTCGLHFRAKGDLVYLKASTSNNGTCSAPVTYCLNATTFADEETSACTDAGLDEFTLTEMVAADAAAALADTKTIVAKGITGFIDFTEGTEVEDAPAE